MQDYITVQNVATKLGVKEETVRRWLRSGKLKGTSFGRAGYRINESDFQAFLHVNNGSDRTSGNLKHLMNLCSALLNADSSFHVAEVVLQHALVAMHANAGVVLLLNKDRTTLITLRIIGYPQSVVDSWSMIPADAPTPVSDAVRERTMLIIESLEERHRRYPHLSHIQALGGDGALVALPLLTRDQPLGGLGFSFPEDRTLTGDDRTFLSTIAQLCTQALERVGLEETCKKVEDALEHSEARLRMALNNTTITIYQQDLELRYAWIYNPLPAFTSEGIIGKTDADFVLPEEASQLTEIKQRVIQSGKGVRVEQQTTSDAGVRFHDLTVEPLRDNSGAISGVIGTSSDITDRKNRVQALRESEERFRLLMNSNIIGLVIANLSGTLIEANQSFLNMVDYTREDLATGTVNWNTLTHPDYYAVDAQAIKELHETGVAAPWEKEYVRKDGNCIPVLVGAVMLKREAGEHLAFIIDITDRTELERRKDEFISMASHELKTPVTSIKGFTQILHNRLNKQGDEQLLHFVSIMDGLLNKLTRLINDLLELSRIQAGKFSLQREPFDLDTLVQETVEMQQAATQTHHLRLEGVTHTQVNGDRDRIQQVLINLVSNAIKYSPQADQVVIRTWAESERACVSVEDFGIGISEHHQQQVFERFYQVTDPMEKTFPGLGIGLYISSEIIKRHQGRLWVESKKGEGATFSFSLPLMQ